MAWRKPTTDDIIASLSVAELNAYKASANWEADPVSILLKRASAIARDAIRTNGNVTMSPDEDEIPEGCISPAIDYVVFDIVKRIGGSATEERKTAREEAVEYFERICTNKLRPESYGAKVDAQNGGAACEVVQESRHRMTPDLLEGI